MDGFADSMIARGPTLSEDRETATGSLHVLSLPNAAAAAEFVANEPNNRAGVCSEHSIWRFENLLGRTMWEFSGDADDPKFLVVARAHETPTTVRPSPPAGLPTAVRDRLILYGALLNPDDSTLTGIALALAAPDRATLDTLLRDAHLALEPFPNVEVHNWEFGGRR